MHLIEHIIRPSKDIEGIGVCTRRAVRGVRRPAQGQVRHHLRAALLPAAQGAWRDRLGASARCQAGKRSCSVGS